MKVGGWGANHVSWHYSYNMLQMVTVTKTGREQGTHQCLGVTVQSHNPPQRKAFAVKISKLLYIKRPPQICLCTVLAHQTLVWRSVQSQNPKSFGQSSFSSVLLPSTTRRATSLSRHQGSGAHAGLPHTSFIQSRMRLTSSPSVGHSSSIKHFHLCLFLGQCSKILTIFEHVKYESKYDIGEDMTSSPRG